MYNRAFVFEPPDPDGLAAAVEWLSGRDVPFGVFVADDAVGEVDASAEHLGLERMDESFPGMALRSIEGIQPGEVAADIGAVADSTDLNDFRTVLSAIPEFPTDVELVMPKSIQNSDVIALFVGHVDGQPAACGWLSRSEGVAGVYGIGVREPFRGHGLGNAMTREVLAAGRDRGCEAAVLQSSPMAVPLYERLGFEVLTDYHIFVSSS